MPVTKNIAGHRYYYETSMPTKTEANRVAKHIRGMDNIKSVKITKETYGGKTKVYSVWYR